MYFSLSALKKKTFEIIFIRLIHEVLPEADIFMESWHRWKMKEQDK